ncbi:DUF2254 domain-containing protein [Gilvimarinus polysaccharolyticus]|uniref:DUF2254 domain-containing protein n=1 Tax=Gilvimarinus polysaccharolyticus TaxID=863921 RepID=UPI00067385A5|nr:DUF2254 domain-containing protein [Gilvimarinus polysaccharolyticus]
MLSQWTWKLLQISRQLWMRTVLFAVLAVVTALIAIAFKGWIPSELAGAIGAPAVDRILSILASSMLAVTTFSLSVMVAAYSAATSNISPRATRLLMEDSTTQNALATFVGSFVYSLVGIIALHTGVYGDEGRVILFIVTIAVVVLIVGTILLWINHLSSLGRVGETTDRVEQAASAAVKRRIAHPWLDGRRLASLEDIPKKATAIFSERIGYIQHIDIKAINRWAADNNTQVFIASLPGAFVHPGRALAYCVNHGEESLSQTNEVIDHAYTIRDERSFDQDPRFGVLVLAEIASRALSPAVNDPGTAIDVIGRGMRVISGWEVTEGYQEPKVKDIPCPNVWVQRIELSELFNDFFAPIARDGANLIEVHIRLQKALGALACKGGVFAEQARAHSQRALALAKHELPLADDIATLEALTLK